MRRRIIALTLALFMLVGLCACKSGSNGTELKIGTDDTYPPMEYVGEDAKTIGFDIDVGNAIAEEMGMKAKFESTAWAGIFSALDSNKYDCVISAVSITDERKEAYEMSDAYVENYVVLVTTPGSGIKSPEDMTGKKAAVQIDTTAHFLVDDLVADGLQLADFSQYDTVTQAFDELKLGRVDGVFVDVVVAHYYTSSDPSKYETVWQSDSKEPIGVCIKKGNTELRDKVNAAIKKLKDSGKLKELSQKWFESDISAGS